MALPDNTSVSPEELRQREDLRFGGWRDWLLVLIGAPLALAAMAVFVAYAFSLHASGPVHMSVLGGIAAVGFAAVAALMWLRRGRHGAADGRGTKGAVIAAAVAIAGGLGTIYVGPLVGLAALLICGLAIPYFSTPTRRGE